VIKLSDFEWTGSTAPWKAIQQQMRERVIVRPLKPLPRFVAGVDCAFARDGNRIKAAAVVYDREAKAIVETQTLITGCRAPYVPNFLTFREAPAILEVVAMLKHPFAALLFDGQGIAHPRRVGLAAHIGVLLDQPSVGCAKSRLIGTHDEPGPNVGDTAPLWDKEEQIGVVLRTRPNVKPMYVSIGHRVDLKSAIALTLACGNGKRLPEPTRVADRLSKFP